MSPDIAKYFLEGKGSSSPIENHCDNPVPPTFMGCHHSRVLSKTPSLPSAQYSKFVCRIAFVQRLLEFLKNPFQGAWA
jgi:hypothetical protein